MTDLAMIVVVETPSGGPCDVCRFGPLPMRRALEQGRGHLLLCEEHRASFQAFEITLRKRATRAFNERRHGP